MAYTHYWHRPKTISHTLFTRIRRDIETVAAALVDDYGFQLAGLGGEGQPIFCPNAVAFNSVRRCGHQPGGEVIDFFGRSCSGNCSHEDFLLERVYRPWEGQKPTGRVITFDTSAKLRPTLYVDFTKTDHKPYDLLVQCSLLVLKHHLGNKAIVRSDGTDDEWADAKIICTSRLGYGDEYVLDDEFGLIRGYFRLSDAIADANLAEANGIDPRRSDALESDVPHTGEAGGSGVTAPPEKKGEDDAAS